MTFREDALAGQHIVISGGTGAIGLGIVRKLTDHGARMTVNDLLDEVEAHQRLRGAGIHLEQIHYVRADMTQDAEVRRFTEAARARFGPIHTALCHVGMVIPGPILELTQEDWEMTQTVNVTTAFLLGQVAARAMLADGIPGHLIFTTSWVAHTPWPEIGPYNASKAAMNQLMRSFARELAGRRLRRLAGD